MEAQELAGPGGGSARGSLEDSHDFENELRALLTKVPETAATEIITIIYKAEFRSLASLLGLIGVSDADVTQSNEALQQQVYSSLYVCWDKEANPRPQVKMGLQKLAMGRCVVAIFPCKTALRSHEADITLVAELVKRRPGHATAGQSTTSSEAQGMSEREKANQDFEERALEAIRVDTTKMSSNDDHKYNTTWLENGRTLMSMYKLYDTAEELVGIVPKINGQDVFECHVCLDRFNMQSRDRTNIKSSILAIRQHAASQGHQKNLQVARIMHANAIKTIVDRLPRPAPDAIAIHEGSNNQTYAEYTQLCELINETNTLILGWKRKRNNKSGTAYVPEAVEVATPSKFLRLSDSGREELERLERLQGMPIVVADNARKNHRLISQASF
ncbi:TPA: hypothetical protein ACH3X1_005401 [Trebouxia sp. C0004]